MRALHDLRRAGLRRELSQCETESILIGLEQAEYHERTGKDPREDKSLQRRRETCSARIRGIKRRLKEIAKESYCLSR